MSDRLALWTAATLVCVLLTCPAAAQPSSGMPWLSDAEFGQWKRAQTQRLEKAAGRATKLCRRHFVDAPEALADCLGGPELTALTTQLVEMERVGPPAGNYLLAFRVGAGVVTPTVDGQNTDLSDLGIGAGFAVPLSDHWIGALTGRADVGFGDENALLLQAGVGLAYRWTVLAFEIGYGAWYTPSDLVAAAGDGNNYGDTEERERALRGMSGALNPHAFYVGFGFGYRLTAAQVIAVYLDLHALPGPAGGGMLLGTANVEYELGL